MQLSTSALIFLAAITPIAISAPSLPSGTPALTASNPEGSSSGGLHHHHPDSLLQTVSPMRVSPSFHPRLQPRSYVSPGSRYRPGFEIDRLPNAGKNIRLVTKPDKSRYVEKQFPDAKTTLPVSQEFSSHETAFKACPEYVMKPLKARKSVSPPAIHVEYAAGGTVDDAFRASMEKGELKAEDLKPVFIAVAKAIQCLHAAGIAHFDIKFENVVIDTDGVSIAALTAAEKLQGIKEGRFKLKLIDFGHSALVSSDKITQNFGTPWYLPKEAIYQGVYVIIPVRQGKSIDVASLALSILRMVREYPYKVRYNEKLYRYRLKKGDLIFKEGRKTFSGDEMDPQLYDLLEKMLLEPSQRISIDDVLAHPYFADLQVVPSQINS